MYLKNLFFVILSIHKLNFFIILVWNSVIKGFLSTGVVGKYKLLKGFVYFNRPIPKVRKGQVGFKFMQVVRI